MHNDVLGAALAWLAVIGTLALAVWSLVTLVAHNLRVIMHRRQEVQRQDDMNRLIGGREGSD